MKFIARLASGILVILFFIYLIFLVIELVAGNRFSMLPFQEHSIGFRIGLTLFWFVFWVFVYRALGGAFIKKRNSIKEKRK